MNDTPIPSGSTIVSTIEAAGFIEIAPVRTSDPDSFLTDLVGSFAKPVSYFNQPMIMDVRPKKGANPASYAGTGKLDLHTDISWYSTPPMYIAMICIDPGERGGVPLISDGWKALTDLDQSTVEQLKSREVRFAAPDHVNYSGHTAPIVSQIEGKYRIRFRPDLLKDTMSDSIDRFINAVNKRGRNIVVSPGSIWIADNYRMLHGRTEIPSDVSSKRFFKRMYAIKE